MERWRTGSPSSEETIFLMGFLSNHRSFVVVYTFFEFQYITIACCGKISAALQFPQMRALGRHEHREATKRNYE